MMTPREPSALDDFLFDLNGYLILQNAVGADLLAALNQAVDQLPPIAMGGWLGNAQRRDYTKDSGLELHNCVELGRPFEELIDSPGWIQYVRRYCGEQGSYVAGLFIDEAILSVRRSGGHHAAHSGGYQGALRGAYRYANGVFRCGQCNIILALTDIGPGDGPTMIVPGSHKSNFPHPNIGNYNLGDRMDKLEGAVELHLAKGDALLFVDTLSIAGAAGPIPASAVSQSTATAHCGERPGTVLSIPQHCSIV